MSRSGFPPRRRLHRAALASALAVGGTALASVATNPAGASSTAAGPVRIYLVLPNGLLGEGKTAGLGNLEELSAFSLSLTKPGSAKPVGIGASAPTAADQVTATMGLNELSAVGLPAEVQEVPHSTSINLTVDFYNGPATELTLGHLYLSYAFAHADITSYLLQDASSGASVQITFTFSTMTARYGASPNPGPGFTVVTGKVS